MATLVVGGLLGPFLVTGGLGPPEVAAPALTFAEALYAELAGLAPLVALVGARIYPLALPQSATLPAVTYQVVSNERTRTLAGRTRDRRARVQLKAISADDPEARRVAEVLADHFDPAGDLFAGPLGGSAFEVREAFVGEDRDLYREPRAGDDEGRRMATFDLILRYREPAG